ncbi:hypothetical protein D0T84_20640 [Dysgonomonas sp. 521]|uniref:hypothetical protein n=1 Tax=Dysgonomonas sp. 521 TaxID=2302932 RepID=UPI0013D0619F|nr:hypothetical protein [Dysgonomonas sp. 521]NDV97290.1 hypothetical protein [Dysgonomonas sp. 521]
MKTTKTQNKIMVHWRLLLATIAFLLCSSFAGAQVTVGSNITPTRAALLDLKARQTTGKLPSVTDDANTTVAEGDGGLLLPRVELENLTTLDPFIQSGDADYNNTQLKLRLAGLMVYNIKEQSHTDPNKILRSGVYVWDGEKWGVEVVNEAASSIVSQPRPFTFYETGKEPQDKSLTFVVDGPGEWVYQWYQVMGNNIHVSLGTPINKSDGTVGGIGDTSPTFTPEVFRQYASGEYPGITLHGRNSAFYKFYCVATSSEGIVLTSDIAEVAVGCGAKNTNGEWISFMCFNLGAENGITIEQQKNHTIHTFTNATTGKHAYIEGEENVWGSLFQWGRIVDGHEKRLFANGDPTNIKEYNDDELSSVVLLGKRCTGTSESPRPYYQVNRYDDVWHGKFIYGASNWIPTSVSSASADAMWKSGRFVQNDPCAHYKIDGNYQEFWYDGEPDATSYPDREACQDTGTFWRTPTQGEWASIYRGGTVPGSSSNAMANTWIWHEGTTTNYSPGYEIKPDGITTTLFLPANGNRSGNDGLLYNQGTEGYYWTVTANSTNAYHLFFDRGTIAPANSANRSTGIAIRCIRNS